MNNVFLTILNMSLTGAFVIAGICLARLLLKKAPKIISYCLWAVAGFRLVCPFSIESVFSLIPIKAQTIPQDIATQAVPRIDSGMPVVNNAVNRILPAAVQQNNTNPLQIWIDIGSAVWLAGLAAMLIYGVLSFIILKRKMKEAAYIEANIYEAKNIKSPFVLGVIAPKIYLPVGLSAQEIRCIVLHEQAHIRRRDHLIKFAGYVILCLHWFNPLVWIAFLLMGTDMEMSCDERVLKDIGSEAKKDYSLSLLSLATERRSIGGSPLAFGEGSVKGRIKNVLNFKKSSKILMIAAVALVAVLSAGFAGNKPQEPLPWTGVPQKSVWPVRDMSFDRVTFGSDREVIVYRMGREPDAEDVLNNQRILYYHEPSAMYIPEGGQPTEVPGSAYDVTFYVDSDSCIDKKQLYGVYRIDIAGGIPGGFEMTGREQGDGTLSGVLAQYGGPNAVDHEGDSYILWYYSPDDTDQRLWFEVKDGELTGRMGIICMCGGEGSQELNIF